MSDRLNLIESVLGTPYYKEERVLLYNMDCLEGMDKLKKLVTVDLTLTSPPYNIGKEYEKILEINDYVDWCSKWMEAIYQITSSNGAFWLNVGYTSVKNKGKAVPLPYLLWDKSDFYLIQELVWRYGAGVASKKSLSPRNEKVLWYVKNEKDYIFNLDDIRDPNVKYPNQKKNGKLKVNPLGKNPSDVWDIPKVTSGFKRSSRERANHPAQTPIELFKRIILASSNTGDLVMDPFLGSGTAVVAAKGLDRYSIGFDLNSNYLDIAIKRLKEENVIQQALF